PCFRWYGLDFEERICRLASSKRFRLFRWDVLLYLMDDGAVAKPLPRGFEPKGEMVPSRLIELDDLFPDLDFYPFRRRIADTLVRGVTWMHRDTQYRPGRGGEIANDTRSP